jgi:hypothetical protein
LSQLEKLIESELDAYNRVCDYAGYPERSIYNTRRLAEDIAKSIKKEEAIEENSL